jgi:hypothetical protein
MNYTTLWHQKTTLVNAQCGAEKYEYYVRHWQRRCKVMDSHLNSRSFEEYTGHFILVLKD